MNIPRMLYANDKGKIFDAPGLAMAGMSGGHFLKLQIKDLFPLPPGSDLFMLPHRSPVGFDEKTGTFESLDEFHAVAAFVAPAYTLRALVAYRSNPKAEPIPLNAYSAVGFLKGRYYVPAFRVDPDPRQDIETVDPKIMERNRKDDDRHFRNNQALEQMKKCCFVTCCPAARNYFHRRWEAPMPTANTCNARCVGCLSLQPKGAPPSPMLRLKCRPLALDMVDLMVPHLEKAERAIASFGQGCEGEPLMNAPLLMEILRGIRARTRRGTLNLNTNASRPHLLKDLKLAGLDSIRVSINSARKHIYENYHCPVGYGFKDVLTSIRTARELGLFISFNYFVFPGITDALEEITAMLELLKDHRPDFIQMRNMNMDPDLYLRTVGRPRTTGLGIDTLMQKIHHKYPKIRFGYYNPPKEWWGKAGTVPPEHRTFSLKDAKKRVGSPAILSNR